MNELLQLLQRLEYSKHGNYCHICPDCGENFIKYGHDHNCQLAIHIKNLGGEVNIRPLIQLMP